MLREELDDLRHLPNEIKSIDGALAMLETLPHRIADRHRLKDCAEDIDDLRTIYHERRARCIKELDRLNAFVDRVKDPLTKQAIRLHYAEGRNWVSVAMRLTDGAMTDYAIKQRVYRALKGIEKSDREKEQGQTAEI